MFRVSFGALISLIDLGTEINVINLFWEDRTKYGFFQASLASLVLSVVLQLIVVIFKTGAWGQEEYCGNKFQLSLDSSLPLTHIVLQGG